ncbi:putative mitochondrial protein cyt-4 [Amylocarpus encephaloides]|uniref:Mitochondrial protein cyt-4 n=1 Tax=Amylocarpus encephaloides TaxID=45428 RepID=A0A9P8C9D7_9HELO|nr:putative mitochondrial protein cyt-4 [Amylocarpus encephaloides]
MSGRWAQRSHQDPSYYVPGFVPATQLEKLLPYLPDAEVSQRLQSSVQIFPKSVPREIGKPLLDKMGRFWAKADETCLRAAHKLEDAHRKIAHPYVTTYATLEEITSEVLKGDQEPTEGRRLPDYALYAVHRTIAVKDIGIQQQSKGTLRAGGEYEVISINEASDATRVMDYVRMYIDEKTKCSHPKKWGPLRDFVQRYKLFIRFLESWAASRSFNRTSNLHSIGSQILRAMERYGESEDVKLDVKTGWTFLQEIGVVLPWATRQPYVLRLPSAGQRSDADGNEPMVQGFIDDKLAHLRKDWGHLPVYCIDDVSAHEIDDGVSVEATENPEEFWLHVHVADPAAHINPGSPVAWFAERLITNVYLPERVVSMLDSDIVRSKLGLAAGRPCLTFSAKVGDGGQLLEYNISSGRINNVIYVTPMTLEEASLGRQENATQGDSSYSVGDDAGPSTTPTRKMSGVDDLSNEQKKQLKLLRQIGLRRASLLKKNGALDIGSTSHDISIRFNGMSLHPSSPTASVFHSSDPTIELTTKESRSQPNSPLSYLMILAAEVCGNWCRERGIPSIYRVTPRNPSKADPAEYFRNKVLPAQDDKGLVSEAVARGYLETIGAAQPSTIPGPHHAVGQSIFTRCTSPLRRYTDLLVHWQIGAALEHEHRTKQSLVGNQDESIFPFSTEKLDRLVPRIDTRERVIKMAERKSRDSWFAQFLLRAWKFGESSLPPVLTFVVRFVNGKRGTANGTIPQFLQPAVLQPVEWLKADEIRLHDTFEVEIDDIDVVEGRIYVKPKRRI